MQLSNIFHKRVEFWGKKKIKLQLSKPHLHLPSVYSFEKLQGPHQKDLTFIKSIVHSGTYSSHCPCSVFNKAPASKSELTLSIVAIHFFYFSITQTRSFAILWHSAWWPQLSKIHFLYLANHTVTVLALVPVCLCFQDNPVWQVCHSRLCKVWQVLYNVQPLQHTGNLNVWNSTFNPQRIV